MYRPVARRIRTALTAVTGLLAAATPPATAGAQSLPPGAPLLDAVRLERPSNPADSARAWTRARSAQARFEFARRNHLPWTWDRGSGPCDERIGRFCLWYTDGERKWEPPPEPEPVVAARATLVARLDTAALFAPRDPWIAGQRVRYLVEAGQFAGAIAAARDCRAPEPGWCDALLGFALHANQEFVRAEAAFEAALAALPPRERERWTDLSALLDADAARAYRRLRGAERERFERRFWWLADPLHGRAGNDRRTEHFARHVWDRLQDRARSTEGIAWGFDLRELLLRYGWPAGWERIRPRTPSLSASVSLVTHYPSGSRSFDPPLAFVEAPERIEPQSWELDAKRARTGYAPAYADAFDALAPQVALFRRGDSAIVVAAFEMEADSADRRPAAEAALVVAPDESAEPAVARAAAAEGTAVLSLTVPAVPALLSLEAVAAEARRVARERHGLPLTALPAGGMAVSDVLLLAAAEPLPDSLDAAIPLARTSTRARSGEQLGLFWEVYGLTPAAEPLEVAVHLLDERAGWLRRLGVRAGLLRPQAPLAVRWHEAPGERGGIVARSLAIELPELPPGRYTLQLTLTPRGREPLRARRAIEIAEPEA